MILPVNCQYHNGGFDSSSIHFTSHNSIHLHYNLDPVYTCRLQYSDLDLANGHLSFVVTDLGELDPECAAARVDVSTRERFLGPRGRLHRVKLHHGLDAVLLEDDDPQHLAVAGRDGLDDVLLEMGR